MGIVRHRTSSCYGFASAATILAERMTLSTPLVTLQVLATLHNTIALNTATNNKAASTYVNCDCQCSSLTFQDKFGRIQGNCKSADNTGALWCYVDSRSPCLDKQRSVRFSQSGHAWSYQACSTPPRHSAQCNGLGSGNYQQGVICKGSRCSPVGGSYPSSSGQFGSGSYGTSGSYQTGSIANCRHGQNCNVGSSGTFGSSSGGYGSTSSGSIANCRFGQPCNVGYNTVSSSGSFNNFGSSGQQYNPYGSNGQQVSLGSIPQGRKTKEGSVNFS